MALKDIARGYIQELREGIAWVILYKNGTKWDGEAVWSDLSKGGDGWEADDLDIARRIQKIDPDAIIVNGDVCGYFFPDMSIATAAHALRLHYDRQWYRLAEYILYAPRVSEKVPAQKADPEPEPDQRKPVKWADLSIWNGGIMAMLMAMPSYVGRDVYRQDSGSG